MFWSDLGSAVGYEAIGRVESSLPTVAVFAKLDLKDEKRLPYNDKVDDSKIESSANPSSPESSDIVTATIKSAKDCPPSTESSDKYDKGVIFYMEEDRIVGILLWNVFNRISIARRILMSDERYDDLNEVAKLFDFYDQHNADKQN